MNHINNMFKQRLDTGFGDSLALSVSLNIALPFPSVIVTLAVARFAVFGSALNLLLMSCSVE